MRTLLRASLLFSLVLVLAGLLPGCQDYGGLEDTGVLPGEEPADEESDPGCDGGHCGVDEEIPQDCCGPDEGPDQGPDGSDGECVPPSPQPLSLNLCAGEWGCEQQQAGPAMVLYDRYDPTAQFHEAWLLWEGSRVPLVLRAGLPEGRELPLALGDRLRASASARTPWWSDLSIEVSSPDGLVLYRQQDTSFSVADPQGRCPPQMDPMGCGRRVFPILDGVLEQGLARVFEQDGALRRQWVGELWQYLEMNCDDVPMGWIQSAMVTRALRSACRCDGPADCARDEVCDPYSHGCVRNPCVVMDCAPGYVCDPFLGQCVAQPAWGCLTDADCAPGDLCHPITQACITDFCLNIDCAPCSPLLGGCYGCLHDCQCGTGVCDREARSCAPGCMLNKLVQDLRPENPSAYELYYVCLQDRLDDPGAVVRLFEPAAQCGLSPPAGVCPQAAPVACLIPLERYPNQTEITYEAWARLCHMSRNPLVQRLVGSHYMP